MAGGSTLRFTVEVAADQATKALNAVSVAFNQAGIQSRQSLLGMGKASKDAGAGINTLGGAMRKFASEQRSEFRTARFFVQEIASIAPVSGSAQTALTGLGAALVGGAGVATAFGLVTAGIAYFVQRSKEAKEKAKEFAEQGLKPVHDAAKRAAAAIGDVWAAFGGKRQGGNVARANLAEAERELAAFRAEVDKEKDKGARKILEDALLEAEREIVGLRLALPGKDYQSSKEFDDAAKKERTAREKETRAALRELLTEEAALRDEAAEKIEDARLRYGMKNADLLAQYEYGVRAALQDKLEILRAKQIKEMFRDVPAAKLQDSPDEPRYQSMAGRDDFQPDAGYEDRRKGNEKAERKRERMAKTAGREVGQAFASGYSDVMSRLLDGEKVTFGDFIESVTGTIKQAFLNLSAQMLQEWIAAQITRKLIGDATAISEISGEAGIAGARAAAQVAATPAFPTAPAVGAALAASVLGAMLPYASAAQGYDIPSGVNPRVQLHQREMVLPAKYADVIRRLDRESAGGGITVQINNPADRRGTERLFTENDGGVMKALRKAQRRRRR